MWRKQIKYIISEHFTITCSSYICAIDLILCDRKCILVYTPHPKLVFIIFSVRQSDLLPFLMPEEIKFCLKSPKDKAICCFFPFLPNSMKLKQQKQFQFSNIDSESTKSTLLPFSVPGRLSPDGSAISWSILKSDYRLKNVFFLLFRYLFVTLPGNTVLVLKGFDCRLQVILPQHPVLELLSISETHQGRPLQIFRLFVSTELQLYAFCRHQ